MEDFRLWQLLIYCVRPYLVLLTLLWAGVLWNLLRFLFNVHCQIRIASWELVRFTRLRSKSFNLALAGARKLNMALTFANPTDWVLILCSSGSRKDLTSGFLSRGPDPDGLLIGVTAQLGLQNISLHVGLRGHPWGLHPIPNLAGLVGTC